MTEAHLDLINHYFHGNDITCLGRIMELFELSQSDIFDTLSAIYHSHIFENTHTLHPRQVSIYAREETDSFIEFLKTRDTARVEQLGKQRAREGLGLSSILGVHSFLNQFCQQTLKGEYANLIPTALKSSDIYHSKYIIGYHTESNEQLFTQQKELRQALSTALEVHRRALLIQKHALKTSINAILFTDLDGMVTYVNPAFLSLWGYANIEEVLGMSTSRLLASREPLEVFVSPPRQTSWRGELRAVRKDDTEFDAEMSASPIIDESDRVIGSMASFVDVTERKRLEAQSLQSHKMEALGFLAGSVAHDFNNILTIVRSYLQVIAMEVESESQLFKDIMQVKIAIDRGSGITKQLRFFSKDADGEMVPTDLNEMIVESCELLKHLFPSETKLVLDLEPGLWTITADPSQLSQVLMNFCVNARDAIAQKESWVREELSDLAYTGRIELKTKKVHLDEQSASRYFKATVGQYVRLTIEDNGIGIEKKALGRVFEPFFSTKKSNRNSGLGLSIVYGIIQKHDGFIDVKSEPGEGTSFEVYFPAREDGVVPERARSEERAVLSSRKQMVLVVDDEPQVLVLLRRLLNARGYDVRTAENGKDAIALYKKHHMDIDLVILDIIMPEMNGLECVKEMRQINPQVKVLVNTGYTADDSALQMIEEGAVGLIEKPFDFHTLSKAIKKILRS